MIPSKPRALLLLLALATSPLAHALQTVTARDGETVFAKISQKEVTRITFERGRIRKVTGNAGDFVLEKDEDRGQIFIRPATPDATKPINLFLLLAGVILEHTAVDVGSLASNFDSYSLGPALARSNLDFG